LTWLFPLPYFNAILENKGSESSKCIYGNSQTYVLTIKTDTPKPLKSKLNRWSTYYAVN